MMVRIEIRLADDRDIVPILAEATKHTDDWQDKAETFPYPDEMRWHLFDGDDVVGSVTLVRDIEDSRFGGGA